MTKRSRKRKLGYTSIAEECQDTEIEEGAMEGNIPSIKVMDERNSRSFLSTSDDDTTDLYENAADNLFRTVSSVAAPNFSMGRALSVMLEEVENDDTLDAKSKEFPTNHMPLDPLGRGGIPKSLLRKVQQRKSNAFSSKISISYFTRGYDDNLKNFLIPPEPGRKFSRRESTFSLKSNNSSFGQLPITSDTEVIGENLHDGQEEIHQIARCFNALQKVDLDSFEKLIGSATVKNSLEILADYFLDNVQREWGYFFDLIVPVKQIHAMVIIGCLQLISMQSLISYVPFIVLYFGFFLAVYFTLKLLHRKHSVDDFVAWKKLLSIFNERTQSVCEADSNFQREPSLVVEMTSFKTYLKFLFSLALFLAAFQYCGFPTVSAQHSDQSSSKLFMLFGLSCLCTIMTTFESMDCHARRLNATVLALYVLLILPKILSKSNTFLTGVDNFWTCVILWGNVSFKLTPLSVGFAACLLIYSFEITKHRDDGKRGKHMAAHALSLLWWQTCSILLESITLTHLGWTDFGFAASLAWLYVSPKIGIFMFFIMLLFWYGSKSVGSFDTIFRTIFTITALISPVIITRFFHFFTSPCQPEHSNSSIFSILRNRKNILIVFYGMLVIGSAMFMYRGSVFPDFGSSESRLATYSNLTWDQFKIICGSQDEEKTHEFSTQSTKLIKSQLQNQIACFELHNIPVFWTGVVSQVEIAKVDNFFEAIFSFLPDPVAQWLICFYGTQVINDQLNGEPSAEINLPRQCTLKHHNVYTFHIQVQKVGGPGNRRRLKPHQLDVVILIASHIFNEIIDQLHVGDLINFVAKFDNYFYKAPARLKLVYLDILNREIRDDSKGTSGQLHASGDDYTWSKVCNSLFYIINFLVSPVVRLRLI